jgi:hypothetical protein
MHQNPNQSIASQQELARTADYMLEPGQQFPAEASSSLSEVAASASGAAVASSATETGATTVTSSDYSRAHNSGSLSGGEVAAVVVGVVVIVMAGLGLTIWRLCFRGNIWSHHHALGPPVSTFEAARKEPQACDISVNSSTQSPPYDEASKR